MSARTPALIAALALILMAVVAPIAHFGTMRTVRMNPVHSPELFVSIGLFLLVILLDIIVALALHRVFRLINSQLSAVAVTLRLVYAMVFLLALSRLMAPNVAHFDGLWNVGLSIFGCHLGVLGFLAVRQEDSRVLSWVGTLLFIAGLGYIFDAVVALVGLGVGFEVASVGFLGEVALIGWLLWIALNRKKSSSN